MDYYNVGPSGDNSPDVFDVAATDNGVVYTLDCCGKGGIDAAASMTVRISFAAVGAAVVAVVAGVVW